MSSREQKKLQTRRAFFNAALDLCMTGQSFSSISLRQITREVGVVPTAFYRHFDDMESLGQALVIEELGGTMATLSEGLHIGKTRSFERQIAKSIQLFLQMVSEQPYYWQFLVSERFGGSEAVRNTIDKLLKLHIQSLSEDLALQPAFSHINDYDRLLLADAGINMFFSWIIDLPKPIDGVLSLNEYQEVDCISKRFKVLRRKAFTDSLGEGSEHVTTSFSNFATTLGFVLKEKQEDEWEIAGPKTVNAAAIEYVCKGPTTYWIDIWSDEIRELFN